jgi:drug/metabolite transporter (DMT)-like permease
MSRNELLGIVLAGGGMLVLGASVAVSGLLLEYPFFTSQAVRYALATVVLALVARSRGLARPALTLRDLLLLVALAQTGLVGFNFALLRALQESEPAAVGVVVACAPLALAVVGPLARQQVPSGRVILAALIVTVGAAIVRGSGAPTSLTGLVYALLALAGEVAFSLLAVPLLPRISVPSRRSPLAGLRWQPRAMPRSQSQL